MSSLETTLYFGTRNPRKNLPEEVRGKRAEVLFQNAFLRVWRNLLQERGIGGIQFELPGFGIADYLWVGEGSRIDAFEFKLNDWRKGATQASRYRCYANRALLVLPLQVAKAASAYLDEFTAINIGLIGYDRASNEIFPFFIPQSTSPLNPKAYHTALSKLSTKRNFRKLSEPMEC